MLPTLLCVLLFAASTVAAPIADLSSPPATTDTNIVFPPVTQVLALMLSPTQPPSSSTTATATMSATTVQDASIHLGPGLVVVATSTSGHTTIKPTASASSAANPDNFHTIHPAGAHKLMFFMIVVLTMITLVIGVYTFSSYRHKRRMAMLKMATTTTRASPVENDNEKGRGCSIVHITRDFPRSKFSVTSSDYPISTRLSASTAESELSELPIVPDGDSDSSESEESDADNEAANRGLMNPAHFFNLRAASMAARHRHARGDSAPVFGISRREQSRRSRSVSGPREEL